MPAPSREELPIDAHLGAACAALAEHGALVLVAEPGAGKTTRLPPALVEAGLVGTGRVLVLEPRRVAARAAARRVAEERGGSVGDYAGYQVRHERRHSRATRVLYLTEGLLTRRLQDDPELSGVGAVVLDEFHERSLHADLALALLADVRRNLRPDLKLVVTSATLDAEPIAAFLSEGRIESVPIVRVPGRAHPLEIEQLDAPDPRRLPVRVVAGIGRALARTRGDVLVFLPGVGEIRAVSRELDDLARRFELDVLPLYGEQRAEEQDRALAPSRRRKVLLATNVAETSLTVPGVEVVVDSGLARVASHDPGRGLDALELVPVSRASATQRAGRAGRTGPGLALQLWTAAEQTRMPERETPEVRRVDLAPAALELHLWGERELATFGWFEAPEAGALERAEALLVRLGAIAPDTRAITALGRELARVPAHPRLARLLHEAARLDVLSDGAACAALVSEPDPLRDMDWAAGLPSGPSDLFARLDLWHAGSRALDPRALRAVERASEQLGRVARRSFASAQDPALASMPREERLLRVVLAGFPDRVARRRRPGSHEARLVGGTGVELAPASVVRDEELFCVLDARGGGGRANARARIASAVRRVWLAEIAGGALHEAREVVWDEARERVVGRLRVLYEDLPLEEKEGGEVDAALARALVLDQARRDPLGALRPSTSALRFLARLRSLADWAPELALPLTDDAELVEALDAWCGALRSFAELRALPLVDAWRARLTRDQTLALERMAPESVLLPTGTNKRLDYEPGRPPVLAARLQELFGERATPTVAGGRVPVLLHLLAPNQRVVQVTQDLESFWNNTYPQVRKDLRGRYPKHAWPEDPWSAPPTARAKRRR